MNHQNLREARWENLGGGHGGGDWTRQQVPLLILKFYTLNVESEDESKTRVGEST